MIVAMVMSVALTGCDGMIYDDEGDCAPRYKVRFVFDKNLSFADAFSNEVNSVTLYIIDPDLTEEDTAAIVEKFKTLIEQNGTLGEVEEWGKRKLAYLINDKPEGYYVLVKFTAAPEFPAELYRVLGITEGVMRSLITVQPE